ncbi:MAG: hypothetical protein ABIO81_06130 [Ginsengibacter sp.]
MQILILSCIYLFITINIQAQVPVSKEPRHHLVFENNKVRILNVLVLPGDTTQYHVHSTPSVFIPFTKTRTGSQRINEQPEYGTSVAGNVWFEDLSEPHIKIHRVWNVDTSVFHVMDIELLKKETRFISNPPAIPHAHIQIDTPFARTYIIKLAKNEELNIKEQTCDFILVAINDSEIKMIENGKESRTFIESGQYYWINANDNFLIFNRGNTPANFTLVSIN